MEPRQTDRATEETPLLAQEEPQASEDGHSSSDTVQYSAESALSSHPDTNKPLDPRRRWPSLAALATLFGAVLLIVISGFLAPTAMKEYASQAIQFEATRLSLDSFTESGALIQVEGVLFLNATRVEAKSIRRIGRLVTWIAREVEVGPSDVHLYLPKYGNAMVGSVKLPKVKISIRNLNRNNIDSSMELIPGNYEELRDVTSDLLDGHAGTLRIRGEAEIQLKSGLIYFGKRGISQILEIEEGQVPTIPKYKISRLNVRENLSPNHQKNLQADIGLLLKNKYAIDVMIPSLVYEVMVENCATKDPLISVGTANTQTIHVKPRTDIHVDITGEIGTLSKSLTTLCPDSQRSPLDILIRDYIQGMDTTVYVRSSGFRDLETPLWAKELIKNMILPVTVPGHEFQHLLKNFSLSDVHLKLPPDSALPESPEARPLISANIRALIKYPKEIKFALNVTRVAAKANVYFEQQKLGELDLSRWQKATSSRNGSHSDQDQTLTVNSTVHDAPLKVTDGDVLSKVIQKLLFQNIPVNLLIEAEVNVELSTAIGQVIARQIPANGTIHLAPPLSGPHGGLAPRVGQLEIVETDSGSITLQAKVNFTNPTAYSLTAPFVDIKLLSNGTIIGHATAENCVVTPGNNTNLPVTAIYDPLAESGKRGIESGRELLSQYLSGFNTSITLQTHNGTIPSQPLLGNALKVFSLKFETPKLQPPKDPDGDGDEEDDSPRFIRETKMHLLSSTAIFTLASPLKTTTIYLTSVNATALYHESIVGQIIHELPFAVPPGISQTPRLPVEWSLGSVGFEAVRKALGGRLKLNATADVGVRIGMWEEKIWFVGHGIGAKVEL